jgi:hypothetical protein
MPQITLIIIDEERLVLGLIDKLVEPLKKTLQ